MPIVLSPATHQVLSYLAHEKQPPATIADPKCRPSLRDAPYCNHVAKFAKRGQHEGACAVALQTLERVGYEKGQCTKLTRVFGYPVPIQAEMTFRSSCRSGTYYSASGGVFYGTKLSLYDVRKGDVPALHKRMTMRFALKERLNKLGEVYNRSIDDTGVYTVLKFLNDLEAVALNAIVERDAPELANQVNKFHANTKFTYKAIGADPYSPPYYSPTRKPRDLTSGDYHTCGSITFIVAPYTQVFPPRNTAPL